MLDIIFANLFNLEEPDDWEEYEKWVVQVAEKIASIINESEGKDELTDKIVKEDILGWNFINHDKTLINAYNEDKDVEKAAYKILNIIKNHES